MKKPNSTLHCAHLGFMVLLLLSFCFSTFAIATTQLSENIADGRHVNAKTSQKEHDQETKFKGFFHPKPILKKPIPIVKPVPIFKPIPKPIPIIKPIPIFKPIPKSIPIIKPIPKPIPVYKPIPKLIPVFKPIPIVKPIPKPIPTSIYKHIPKSIPIVKPIPKPFLKPKPFFKNHIPKLPLHHHKFKKLLLPIFPIHKPIHKPIPTP